MLIKHSTLLKSLLLFVAFLVLQIVLIITFHYFIPYTAINDLMLLTIDISLVFCVVAGFKYFNSETIINTNYRSSFPIFIVFLILSFLWFFISPLFKIDQQQWSMSLSFTMQNLNDVTNNPSFFAVYGILRMLFIVPILEELLYRKIIFSNLLKKYGVYISIIVSSVLFSIGHLDFNNSIIFLVFGILLGVTYWKTKSFYYPILLHIFINAMTFFLI